MSMLKNMLKGGTICGLLAAGAMFAAAPTAKAALVVNLNGGTTITDNGAGDTDPATGQITNSSTVAGFGVAITVAESNSPGTSSSGLIQISSLSIKNQGAGQGSLTISVSDNNYTAPGTNGSPMLLESDIGGTFAKGSAAGDSVSFRSFVDPANVQPATVNGTAALSFSNPSSTDQRVQRVEQRELDARRRRLLADRPCHDQPHQRRSGQPLRQHDRVAGPRAGEPQPAGPGWSAGRASPSQLRRVGFRIRQRSSRTP